MNPRTHKSAAIAGVYQYDTGQRLRMRGLPTPDELAEMDDFLAGDVVTVQAQYGYAGDSQTETRIASFDAETGCWMADIPDVYLKRSGAVKVFVYVSYGATADETRAKTCYEGSFTPISRPAPSTQVTPSQRKRMGRAGDGNQPDALEDEHGDFRGERGGRGREDAGGSGTEGRNGSKHGGAVGEHAGAAACEHEHSGADAGIRQRKHGADG